MKGEKKAAKEAKKIVSTQLGFVIANRAALHKVAAKFYSHAKKHVDKWHKLSTVSMLCGTMMEGNAAEVAFVTLVGNNVPRKMVKEMRNYIVDNAQGVEVDLPSEIWQMAWAKHAMSADEMLKSRT